MQFKKYINLKHQKVYSLVTIIKYICILSNGCFNEDSSLGILNKNRLQDWLTWPGETLALAGFREDKLGVKLQTDFACVGPQVSVHLERKLTSCSDVDFVG